MKKCKIALGFLIIFLSGMLCDALLHRYIQDRNTQNKWEENIQKEQSGECGTRIADLFLNRSFSKDIGCKTRNILINKLLNAALANNGMDDGEKYDIKVKEIYMEFLYGERKAYSNQHEDSYIDIELFIIPTGEPERRNACWYTLFDCTNDGIPELHIQTAQYYYVLTCVEDKLVIWNAFHPRTTLLNNGAFLYDNNGGLAHEDYCYQVLNCQGEIMHEVWFSKYEGSGEYEELYFYESLQVTKEEWEHLTEPYLSIGHNEIEWIDYYTQNSYIIKSTLINNIIEQEMEDQRNLLKNAMGEWVLSDYYYGTGGYGSEEMAKECLRKKLMICSEQEKACIWFEDNMYEFRYSRQLFDWDIVDQYGLATSLASENSNVYMGKEGIYEMLFEGEESNIYLLLNGAGEVYCCL